MSLLATNANGCSDTFYKDIYVAPEFTLYIPNAFTPNGDGLDDNFLTYAQGIISFKMDIFNRWGEVIFTSTEKDAGWDGKDSFTKIVPNGIYLYRVSVTDFNRKVWVYNGEINLIR